MLAQSVKLCKHEELSSIPRTHGGKSNDVLVTLVLEEAERGRVLELLVNQPR